MNALLAESETLETIWRLQTHWTWAPWFTVLFVAAAIAVVVFCYRWEETPARGAYRSLLGLLRLTTIGLLLLMLSEAVFSGVRSGRPRMAIVLDRSESMQRRDVISDGFDQPAISREAFARSVLLNKNASLVEQLAEEYELELLMVDETIDRSGENPEAITAAIQSDSDSSDARATRLGDAIERLLAAGPTAPLKGVLLLTDGQSTVGTPLSQAAESARRAGVPLYFLGLGSEEAPPTASLTDLLADETAFVDDLVRFQATLHTRGLEGKQVKVELLRSGEAVAQEIVSVAPDAEGQPVRLLHRPTEQGIFRYTLRASIAEAGQGGEVPPSELAHSLHVRDDKIRVLLAAGYPNYEYRYLKHLLERDETIDVRAYLQEADYEYAVADRTALARFPIREEELAEYDVLVLIDLDPTLLPRSIWNDIGQFVGERGGGLALVAGPRSLPAVYRGRKAFAALCPTKVTKSGRGGWGQRNGFVVTPTELGLQSPAMQLADTASDSQQVWRTLPAMYWWGDVGPPKPAAQVLARREVGGDATPLIVSQYYGAGRVLLHTFDSSWRWRFRVGDVYFARYWVQSLRELARNKDSTSHDRPVLATSKRRYEPGEPVRLRFRNHSIASEASLPDAMPTVLIQSSGRADRRVELSPRAGGHGRYQATLGDLPAGTYRAVLAFAGSETEPVATEFEVVAPPGEASRPEMNRRGMVAAAKLTRGQFFTVADVGRLAEALPQGRPVPIESLPPIELWNRWPLLLGVCLCLSAEWILRKRRSML